MGENMSNKAIDDFMGWLDCYVEEVEGIRDGETIDDTPTHERHFNEGFERALRLVESKAKELGFIIPPYRGHELGWNPGLLR